MRVHDLVCLDRGWIATIPDAGVRAALERTPWAVVRRARPKAQTLALGVRGSTRAERWPIVAPATAVLDCIAPEALARREPTRALPAFEAFAQAAAVARTCGLVIGPTGGVGFELATGAAVVTTASDCDVVIRGDGAGRAALAAFAARIAPAPARIDVTIEYDDGCAVALAEYFDPRALWKTPSGPLLAPTFVLA